MKLLPSILFGLLATASDKPENFMEQLTGYRQFSRFFRDVMIVANAGIWSYIFFGIILHLPKYITLLEIGFVGILAVLIFVKPWREAK